jgi:hypothetical protein
VRVFWTRYLTCKASPLPINCRRGHKFLDGEYKDKSRLVVSAEVET